MPQSLSSIVSHTISGTGRATVLLAEHAQDQAAVGGNVATSLQSSFRPDLAGNSSSNANKISLGQLCVVELDSLAMTQNWQKVVDELIALLDLLKIRNAAFIAFEDASIIAQALCLRRPRLVRTLVFVDGATRAHPSSFVRLLDRVEKFLPLGLPFRSDFPGFDGKPFLQRIRCPVLVALSAGASPYRKEQAKLLVEGMPTSFLKNLSEQEPGADLVAAVEEFQNIPAKCPQKNL